VAGPPGPFPRELKQAGPAELQITWSDGHLSTYPVVYLRRMCRCAACVDEMSGKPILDPAKVSDRVRPIEINPVGRYAVNIIWNDGHSSGIYTYEHLRAICPCCRSRPSTLES
jgi:ATP-binding protein involved in chromosome partitioning